MDIAGLRFEFHQTHPGPRARATPPRRGVLGWSVFGLAVLTASLFTGCGREAPVASPGSTPVRQQGGFIFLPYVQAPDKTAMTILWTSPVRTNFFLKYGESNLLDRELSVAAMDKPIEYQSLIDSTAGQAQRAQDWQYVVRLADLKPGTSYRYQVSGAGETAEAVFRTIPEQPEEFTFIAYGDSRSQPEEHLKVAMQFKRHKPALILHTGDMTDYGAYHLWNGQFFGQLAEMISGVPILTSRGNHEADGPLFYRLFPRVSGAKWFSVDYGNVHFAMLDSCISENEKEVMLEWLAKDLAASKAMWKIAAYHYPSYDVGSHRSTWGREDVLPVLRKGGIDIVLTGHTHGYQRFKPMFTENENEKHPITHIVTAGGGAPLYRQEKDPYLVFGDYSSHHFMAFTVSGNKIFGKAITSGGVVLDVFEIAKQPDGSFDPAYLATALPEENFGTSRLDVQRCMRNLTLSGDPRTGNAVKSTIAIGGEKRMKYIVQLEMRAQRDYDMKPVTGETRAGATNAVEVSIILRDAARFKDPNERPAVLRLECFYEIDGISGSVFSNVLTYRPATNTPTTGGADGK